MMLSGLLAIAMRVLRSGWCSICPAAPTSLNSPLAVVV